MSSDLRRRRPSMAAEALEVRALLSSSGLFGSSSTPPAGHLPTVLTLTSAATIAESGQAVPLLASVAPTGTKRQLKAARSEPISGTVEFLLKSPRHQLLGKVALNTSGSSSSSSLLSAFQSAFGSLGSSGASSTSDTAFVETKALKRLGTYRVIARFLPSNDDFRASRSESVSVTITPPTRDAPTVSTLAVPSTVETGASVPMAVTIANGDSSLADGMVRFVTVGPHPVVLGKVAAGLFNRPIDFATSALRQVGTYQVQAIYQSRGGRFSGSTSAPMTVTITPLTAASFRVTPIVSHGALDQPLGFTVTALDVQGQPLTDYTGTISFSSPTDSWTILPAPVYKRLGISQPSPNSPGMASFSPSSYTFTTADQGSHTFVGAVAFGKAGAETLQVTQADDPEVTGETTFAIA